MSSRESKNTIERAVQAEEVLNPDNFAWTRESEDGHSSSYELRGAPDPTKTIDIDIDHLRRHRIFVHGTDEESKIAISAFKSLRTHMLREMAARPSNSLTITSPTQGVGKSVIAANLAISIARHKEKRVVLVDLDLRVPSIASLFGLTPEFWIESPVTRQGVYLQHSLNYPDLGTLSTLSCVRAHENSTEILLSKEMRTLIKVLQQPEEDRVVIFDAPPILGCDDVAALTSITGLYLVVIGERETSRRELKTAMSVLADTPVAGIVLNKTTQRLFKRYSY